MDEQEIENLSHVEYADRLYSLIKTKVTEGDICMAEYGNLVNYSYHMYNLTRRKSHFGRPMEVPSDGVLRTLCESYYHLSDWLALKEDGSNFNPRDCIDGYHPLIQYIIDWDKYYKIADIIRDNDTGRLHYWLDEDNNHSWKPPYINEFLKQHIRIKAKAMAKRIEQRRKDKKNLLTLAAHPTLPIDVLSVINQFL